MSDLISKAWPFDFSRRETQEIALNWLEKNIDKKYFIMQIPVGGGKSFIGLTFARMLDKQKNIGLSYIMTPQVLLQKQYLNDFSLAEHRVGSIYGKSRYNCLSKKTTCNIGSKIKKPRCHNCPYQNAIASIPKTENLVINYAAALTHFHQGTDVFTNPRSLIIADECHVLEDQLTEFDSFSISGTFCKTKLKLEWIKKEKNPFKVFKWIKNEYMPKLTRYMINLASDVEEINGNSSGKLTPEEIEIIKEFDEVNRMHQHVTSVMKPYAFNLKLDEALSVSDDTSTQSSDNIPSIEEQFESFNNDYILVSNELTKKFKARKAGRAFSNILEPKADKFLFMSSTIIDHVAFCEDLGIDVEEAAFFDIDSEFQLENRLVYRIPTIRMDRTWKQENRSEDREKMINTIKSIINLHATEKGIIHTANFEISDWILNEIKNDIDHRLYHHNDPKYPREKTIKAFLNDPKPSILISPSCTEGLDLKGDLGRFAIFAKVPYPYLGDQWIKAKCDESQEWYSRQAILSIIQGSGRVVRSKDDYGSIYILDDLFDRLYSQWGNNFPDWWKESVVQLDSSALTS